MLHHGAAAVLREIAVADENIIAIGVAMDALGRMCAIEPRLLASEAKRALERVRADEPFFAPVEVMERATWL